jgi:alpha/beta superfamily hydrolase
MRMQEVNSTLMIKYIDIGTRVYFLEYYFRKLQVNIMLIAYRGYSDSTGIPTERGLMNDGEAIVKYVLEREDIDRTKIFLHGRSLGGAVASYVIT